MNVRCPHCSAVFPAGNLPDTGSKSVECPLCLLRFDAAAETTTAVPQAAAAAVARASAMDDEFEQFGVGGSPSVVIGGAARQGLSLDLGQVAGGRTVPLTSTTLQPIPSTPSAAAADTGGDDADIDFDSLLSDAAVAVDKRAANNRTNPFARIASPRAGGAPSAAQESVFGDGRRISQPLVPTPDILPTQVLPGGSSGMAELQALIAARNASPQEDDSLFEANATYRPDDDDAPKSRPIGEVAPTEARRRPANEAGKGAAAGKKKSWVPQLTFDGLLGLAMIVAALGVAADFAGYGLFAAKLWKTEKEPAPKAQRALPADLSTPVALDDTRKAYELELARLDKVVKLRPGDAAIAARRIAVYLDLFERYPEALEEPEVKAGFEQLKKSGKLPKARVAALEAYAKDGPAGALQLAQELKAGSADDRALLVRMTLLDFDQRLMRQALDSPGLTSSPDIDPLRTPGNEDKQLVEAAALLDGVLRDSGGAENANKFKVLKAQFADRMARQADVPGILEPVLAKAPEHLEAHLTLASSLLDLGKLDAAQVHLDKVTVTLTGSPQPAVARQQAFIVARQAGRRGDHEAQISVLEEVMAAGASDELTTVRLARLHMAEHHLDDARKLLQNGKTKQNFKSVAFEVAMVEYWLAVNRNEDALQEISEATKNTPDSLELLYLRGQVEDKQAHYATARDYFSQVLQREPRHLRAAIRLAELQSAAGRHDESLATLENARKQVGDEETLLRLVAEELDALKRPDEARKILDMLLHLQPDNRRYLLRAAQMDLRAGRTDQALEFLRRLRKQKALDRAAATQLALALAEKKDFAEAAATVEPFADQAPADVEMNTLAGKLELDAGQTDKAAVYIGRAVQTASGKSAEALFQHGRLAFRGGDATQGTQRIKQAIEVDPMAHEYRFELARSLLSIKGDAAVRKLAVDQLETVVRSAAAFQDAGRPVRYLADVHRLLAKAFLVEHHFGKAVKALRAVLELSPDDLDSKALLGRCLVMLKSDEAAKPLREVLARRPSDPRASLYLGMHLLGKRQNSDALPLLQVAANSGNGDLVEAWYHIALIYKERDQLPQALKALETYLEKSPDDDYYRPDATSLRRTLQTTLGAKKSP